MNRTKPKTRIDGLTIIDAEQYVRAWCVNGHLDTYPPGEFLWGSAFCGICCHSMQPYEMFFGDDVPEDFAGIQ